MPDKVFERRVAAILRDDLLAQLRAAGRPLTTSELRANAPEQPLWPGAAHRYRPPQEQIYRILCRLAGNGKIIRHPARGRTVTWSPAPTDDDTEIDEVERAFNAIAADRADPLARHIR